MRALERFFVNIYSPLIQGPARFGFIGVFFVMFVFFGYFAMQMEPPVDPEQWFPNDHMLTKLGIQNTLYIGGNEDRYVGGKLVWGITGVERGDEFNRWVPDKRGSAVFDPSFDLSTAAAQDFYQATCDRFRTEACAVVGCMDGTSMLTRPGEVSCFIEDWRAWYTSQSCGVCEDDPAAPFLASGATCASLISSGTVTCTTDLVTVHAIATPGLATIADHCQATCAVCDVVAGDTCHTTVVFPTGPAFVESLIAFRSDPVYFFRWGDQIGVIGNQLKYVTINFVSTLQHDNPQVTTRTMYELLEKIVGEQNVAAPAGMKGLYHCDGGVYTWMETQKGLVDNVFQGFSICFPAAFIVLLLSTHNLLTATLAITTIIGVVGCVLGVCKFFMGWGLGVAESIAAVIVIGFSVDFTVHLAHMYSEAGHHFGVLLRGERMAASARTMGVTVTMGACTTLGSGLMLWACTLTFFTKFAVLIISTILFSLGAALFFFMPLSATIGPEGDFADVVVMYKNLTGGGGDEPAATKKEEQKEEEEEDFGQGEDSTENPVAKGDEADVGKA